MKTESNGYFSNVLLTGTLLLANMDVNGYIDYGIKAAIGGAVWLIFKVTADFIERRRRAGQ
jgi:hypothetical protein